MDEHGRMIGGHRALLENLLRTGWNDGVTRGSSKAALKEGNWDFDQ
jgi:hypothetical protein